MVTDEALALLSPSEVKYVVRALGDLGLVSVSAIEQMIREGTESGILPSEKLLYARRTLFGLNQKEPMEKGIALSEMLPRPIPRDIDGRLHFRKNSADRDLERVTLALYLPGLTYEELRMLQLPLLWQEVLEDVLDLASA